MKKLLLSVLIVLTGCAAGHRVMTMNEFHGIPVGTTAVQLQSVAGKPYTISKHDEGGEEYEYIERLTIGSRIATERHYYFILKEGKVVSKRVEDISPPPYLLNSYDLQSTSSDAGNSEQKD